MVKNKDYSLNFIIKCRKCSKKDHVVNIIVLNKKILIRCLNCGAGYYDN